MLYVRVDGRLVKPRRWVILTLVEEHLLYNGAKVAVILCGCGTEDHKGGLC